MAECQNCGSQLWTHETQTRFQEWMAQLKQGKRDLFQIQFYMPDQVRHELKETVKSFPGVPSSSLIRAMTSVYLSSLIRLPDFRQNTDRIFEMNSYREVIAGPRKKTSLQFGPIALLDIQAWGNILKLSPHKVVEDAIYKSLALKNEIDPGLRAYWDRDLWPQIEMILRSV